jgi:ABC-type transport system substrate-binding protein
VNTAILLRSFVAGALMIVGSQMACASPLTANSTGAANESVAPIRPDVQLAQATPGVASTSNATPRRGGIVKVGYERDVENFEPHRNYGSSTPLFQGHVYDTLIGYDLKGNLVGRLAERWEHPDPLTYVFHLRTAKFHDGSDFSAEDVVFSLDRIKKPGSGMTRAGALAVIDRMEAPDRRTVILKLSKPAGDLPVTLTLPDVAMLSKRWSEAGHDYSKEMNGTGPFRLESFERNVRYSLRRNENFWIKGEPYLDGIDIIPINDTPTRVNALVSGEVDLITLVPWERFAQLSARKDIELVKTFDSFMLLRLNPNRPPFNDVRVRKALNYALDRKAISALAWGGEARPMSAALIPPDSPWFNPAAANTWVHDPAKARALLAEAGLKPSDVKFTLYSIPFVHLPTSEVVVQQLKQFGMDVTLQTIENAVLFDKRGNGDYQAMMDGGSNPVADPVFYAQWFGSSGGNYAKAVGFSVPALDQLFDKIQNETKFDTRKALVAQAEKIILDQAPWGFLVFRPQAEGKSARLKGYYRIPGFGSDSPVYLKLDKAWLEQ